MAKKIMLEVIEARGNGCDQGLKLGDKFELEENHHNFCSAAYSMIYPIAQVMRYGGRFPWEEEKDVQILGCPDPYNTIVFKLTAVEVEE